MRGCFLPFRSLYLSSAPFVLESSEEIGEEELYVIEDKRTGSSVGTVGCSFYEDMGKVGVTYFIGADFLPGKQLGPKNMSSG